MHQDNVIVGFNGSDDAAVVRLEGGQLIVQTVDFFTPIVDDPYQFGQIAAANSLSDIYAMGATPRFALNIVGFPIKELPKEVLTEILRGGTEKAKEAGIPIVGGHSIDDNEPKYGLVVTGEVDETKLIKNSGSQENDALVLTKPLGTGIISSAIKKGFASDQIIKEAVNNMTTLNASASKLMRQFDVHAATDVTGFGLLGHLTEMCRASNVSANIEFQNLPFLSNVYQLATDGIIPGGTKRNLDYASKFVSFNASISKTQKYMVADAQTSGGLLVALPKNQADKYAQKCVDASGLDAKIIGHFTPKKNSDIIVS